MSILLINNNDNNKHNEPDRKGERTSCDVEQMLTSLEEELKHAVLVGPPSETSVISDDDSMVSNDVSGLLFGSESSTTIPTVDLTPDSSFEQPTLRSRNSGSSSRIRRWPSNRSCGSNFSSCSSLGTSSTSSSRRSRDPTVVDFIKATGQNVDKMTVAEMKRYMNRKFIRLAQEWECEVLSHKPEEEENLTEVQQQQRHFDQIINEEDDDDDDDEFFDALDLSCDSFESCLNEEEEEDVLFKASLNPNCGMLEVEGIRLLSELEAET